jgi:CRISPR-associated protein Cas6
MVWLDDDVNSAAHQPTVCEVVFKVTCPQLSQDHAVTLFAALDRHLPWLTTEAAVGIHEIHGGASGNGWVRPEVDAGGDGILNLSKRARLVVRVPSNRADDIRALEGAALDVGGYPLRLGGSSFRELRPESTLFARRVVAEAGVPETQFVQFIVEDLRSHGIEVRKLLCGLSRSLSAPDKGILHARSVLVADLKPRDSLLLQSLCIGGYAHLGCGLFIPHKSIDAVHAADSD